MQELTGFRLVPVSPAKAWATPTALGKQLGLQIRRLVWMRP